MTINQISIFIHQLHFGKNVTERNISIHKILPNDLHTASYASSIKAATINRNPISISLTINYSIKSYFNSKYVINNET